MRSTLIGISALLLGAGAINLGLGLQGSLLGLRANLEGFGVVLIVCAIGITIFTLKT